MLYDVHIEKCVLLTAMDCFYISFYFNSYSMLIFIDISNICEYLKVCHVSSNMSCYCHDYCATLSSCLQHHCIAVFRILVNWSVFEMFEFVTTCASGTYEFVMMFRFLFMPFFLLLSVDCSVCTVCTVSAVNWDLINPKWKVINCK